MIWPKLRDDFKTPEWLLIFLRQLFTETRGRVRLGDLTTRFFDILKGVLQGSISGPRLFTAFINDLLLQLQAVANKNGLGIRLTPSLIISVLCFADDITLIAKAPAELQSLLTICHKWSEKNKH